MTLQQRHLEMHEFEIPMPVYKTIKQILEELQDLSQGICRST